MAELIAKTPCEGLLPLEIGDMSLTESAPGTMTSLAARRGRTAELSDALKLAHGMTFPAPNRATGKIGARLVWFGRGQAMLIGPEPDHSLVRHAALTDQSDAWAMVELKGPTAEEVLARLVPVDLRAPVFRRGFTVRTSLMHMPASITRIGTVTFQIMVFRSMARTLVHDLKTAMENVDARTRL